MERERSEVEGDGEMRRGDGVGGDEEVEGDGKRRRSCDSEWD